MNNTYPSKFYDFRNGVKVKDYEIKQWLEEIKNDLIEADIGNHSFRASGNTFVIGFKYEDEYSFIVCDSYKELSLYTSETDINRFKFV